MINMRREHCVFGGEIREKEGKREEEEEKRERKKDGRG